MLLRRLRSAVAPASYSLRAHLILLVLVAVMPLAVFAAVIVRDDLRHRSDLVSQGTRDTVRALSQAVDRQVSTSWAILETLATSPELERDDLPAFHELCVRASARHANAWMVLFDASGQQIVNSTRPWGSTLPNPFRSTQPVPADGRYPDLPRGGAAPIRKVFDTGRRGASDMFIALDAGRPTIGASIPVVRNGAVRYVLEMSIDPDSFASLLRDQRLPPGASAAILDTTGVLITRVPGADRFTGRRHAPNRAIVAEDVDEGFGASENVEGVATYHAFTRSAITGWVTVVRLPRAALDAGLTRSLAILASAAALVLLGGLAAALALARRISTPIALLARSATQMARGKRVALPPFASKEVRGLHDALVQAGETVQESEERFRMFVEGVTDYAICLLDPEGRVINWNAGAERIAGFTASEIVGRDFSCFYVEEDRKAGAPERALETAAREGRYEEELWRVRKDGSRFMAGVLIARVLHPSGRLVGFAKITRDVSERIEQQKALEQTRAALVQSQKMEALGQLSGGIAHDFNNLLHVIKNAVEVLRRRAKSEDPDVARFADMAVRNADRAASLTQRILAFSRRQPLDPREVHPNKLVLGMAELLRQTLGESVAIETVLGGGVWWVSADPNQLETAILNLAVNARDAMPGGGKLTIETANTFLDEAYAAAHEEVKAGQYVMIALSDTGAGMTKEVIARAFEPFFTTKEVGRGTGLGLSQAYGFIKQSGGHVKIYSEPGEGTTVKLYLPRLAGADAAATTAGEPPVPAGAVGEAILVVEDDEDVRAFTAELLRELGYRVLVAYDAASAREVLEKESHVDLLFTDVGLPGGVNGRQLADEARRRWPAMKVLFTTGYARNAIVHHGRLDPGVQLIVKPFTQADLANKIRRVLDEGERAQGPAD
jgi:PAS domain S-box-containing protein